MSRTPLSLILWAALATHAGSAQQPLQRPIGFAMGDAAYRIETDAVRGEGTLLEGEAISTHVTPARLHLGNGGFAILGIGSQARLYRDRVAVSGVSLEMLRFGSPALPIEAAGLRIAAASDDARVSVFSDQPSVASVMVSQGEVIVSSESGRVLRRMPAGSAATFAQTAGEVRIQESRAALEIGRICMRQLELLSTIEARLPGVRPRRRALSEMLSAASDDLFKPRQRQRSLAGSAEIPTGLAAVDPERLLGVAREVHFRLNQEGLDEAGCGQPECAAADPPRAYDRFFGWAGGLELPPPGCVLCQPGEGTASSAPRPPATLPAQRP